MSLAILNRWPIIPVISSSSQAVLSALHTQRATILATTPHFARRLANLVESQEKRPAALMVIGLGGAPATEDLIDQLEAAFRCVVTSGYGSAEAGGPLTVVKPLDCLLPGTVNVGVPLRSIEIEARDEHGSTTVQTGRLYWRRRLDDGWSSWLATGDVGSIGADGRIHVLGRVDDVIIRNGFKLIPEEIEELLEAHPRVREAAVLGINSPSGASTEVIALVAIEPGEPILKDHEILRYARASLDPWKRPTRIRIVDELPRTPDGKLQRRKLFEHCEEISDSVPLFERV
jgi:acyl-coenzyme A synthetase/AMP-(fatty) acid ligase